MIDINDIPIQRIEWLPCWRIIPSRFPPIDLFERVSTPEEFEMIYEIEQITNPRLRNEMGDIQLVPKEERLFGPGTSQIMAAFTHLPLSNSRFTDGSYGVYYAGNSLETAVAETKYHREKFLQNFNSPYIEIDMRVLLADLNAELHHITGLQAIMPEIYHRENYYAAQCLGRKLRAGGLSSFGIHYDSVRYSDGTCIAIFRPRALSCCRQERHLCYVWDGKSISHIYKKQMEYGV